MLIHLVKSRQLVKPVAQMAVSPVPDVEMGAEAGESDHHGNRQMIEEGLAEIYQNFSGSRGNEALANELLKAPPPPQMQRSNW